MNRIPYTWYQVNKKFSSPAFYVYLILYTHSILNTTSTQQQKPSGVLYFVYCTTVYEVAEHAFSLTVFQNFHIKAFSRFSSVVEVNSIARSSLILYFNLFMFFNTASRTFIENMRYYLSRVYRLWCNEIGSSNIRIFRRNCSHWHDYVLLKKIKLIYCNIISKNQKKTCIQFTNCVV